MGAKITGEGTNEVEIIGVDSLKDTSYQIMPDRIEAGTLLCFAAGTGGSIELKSAEPLHMIPILEKLEECGLVTPSAFTAAKIMFSVAPTLGNSKWILAPFSPSHLHRM